LDISTSFYEFWKFKLFLRILLNQKEKENETRRWASGLRCQWGLAAERTGLAQHPSRPTSP
jgi:hypothetical protein